MAAPDVWVAKADGTDFVRATAIAGVGRDYNGNITVRLLGIGQATVTLVSPPDDGQTPEDFHLQLLRVITELSDTAEPAVVRPAQVTPHGWIWRAGPL